MVNVASLRRAGFQGFVTVASLWQDGQRAIPDAGGVYAVLAPTLKRMRFLARSKGGWFKGNDPTESKSVLASRWVDGSQIVYVGKANCPLRVRIGAYLAYGRGKPAAHYGGRLIWQLVGHPKLIVCWRPTPGEEPAEVEARMLSEFEARHGRLPFANLRGGDVTRKRLVDSPSRLASRGRTIKTALR